MKGFAIFGIPPEVDEFFNLAFLIIFCLSVTLNSNYCGGGALKVFEENFNVKPDFTVDEGSLYIMPQEQFNYLVQMETNRYFKTSQKGFWFGMVLYWFAVPLLCYYYAIFRFKKGMWAGAKKAEDLYTKLYNENITG